MQSAIHSTKLIDPQGEVFEAEALWCSLNLARSMTLPAYVDYACRNLGFIAIEHTEQAVSVSLRPSTITATSEISMLYHLAELDRSQRHVLRQFEGTWNYAILPDFNGLLIALQRLRATAGPEQFIRQVVAPDDPSVPENVKKIIGAWQQGCIDISRPGDLDTYVSGLCDQYMVVRKKKHGDIYFEGQGRGVYAVLGGVGVAPLKGRSLASTANQSYVAKATESYLRTLERGRPILEKVDALSCMNGDQTLQRLQYLRFLVPQKLKNGEALLLSLSVDDRSIDLRRQSR